MKIIRGRDTFRRGNLRVVPLNRKFYRIFQNSHVASIGCITRRARRCSAGPRTSDAYIQSGQSLEARGLTTHVGAGRANDLGVRDTSSWLSGVQLHRLCHRFSALVFGSSRTRRQTIELGNNDEGITQTQTTNHQSKRQEGSELTEFPQMTCNLIP